MRKRDLFVAILWASGCAGVSYGMATAEIGPDSVRGHPTTSQPDWPVGLVELPRHESRVYSFWENGGERFYFKASPNQMNELILLFSKMRTRDHELWIKDRTQQNKLVGNSINYNVALDHIGGIARYSVRQLDKASTYEPKLTIYIDLPADLALAERIKLPDNVIVNNEIASFPLKGKATKPKRETWYARIQFSDQTAAVDYEHGVSTKVTLWEKDIQDGILLGRIDNKGNFDAPFSEKEIADLKAGTSWLTLTVGNWLSEAKRDHPRLNWTSLLRENMTVQPVTVVKPTLYYGRIMYEDGSPVSSGRDLSIDFRYAGSAHVESDGYFRVCFTDDQFEKAKAGKDRKNIYIPSGDNTATARFVFPVSKLSQDKEKAGVVSIPR